MAFAILWMFRMASVMCDQVISGDHPSVVRLDGHIVSRASIQLKRTRNIQINGARLYALLAEWVGGHRMYVTSGIGWTNVLNANGTPMWFLNKMAADSKLFMDIPALARMFEGGARLMVLEVGHQHRQNMCNFLEHCRCSTRTEMAPHGGCVQIPPYLRDVFVAARN